MRCTAFEIGGVVDLCHGLQTRWVGIEVELEQVLARARIWFEPHVAHEVIAERWNERTLAGRQAGQPQRPVCLRAQRDAAGIECSPLLVLVPHTIFPAR